MDGPGRAPPPPSRPRRAPLSGFARAILMLAASLALVFILSTSATAQSPGLTVYPVAVATASPAPTLASAPPVPTLLPHPASDGANGCVDCHQAIDAKQKQISDSWRESVHGKEGIGCADCHGGDPRSDELTVAMAPANGFIGIPGRDQTVGMCGGCHSDVDRMRQFGLATDQYAKYYSSVHGQRLLTARDTRVAICVDCHGSHDVKKISDPTAKVYPLNVPALCASCHADADKMKPYGIPTNQFELYQKSVHGQALLVKQNLQAPSCASCHGAHDAKPPREAEVVNVCGKCHTATQALYEQSPHSKVAAVGPKCWTCHGTHDVSQPDEALFFHLGGVPANNCTTCHSPSDQSLRLDFTRFEKPEDRRCDTCHHSTSQIFAQVQAIAGALGGANTAYTSAQGAIDQAAALGMIVSDADVALTEARTDLIRARAAVHTTKLPTISGLADEAKGKAAGARALADAELTESSFRRQAMLVVIAIIVANVLALVVLRRRMERRGT